MVVLAGCASPPVATPEAESISPCLDMHAVFQETLACLNGTTLVPPDLVEIRTVDPVASPWSRDVSAHLLQPPLIMASRPATQNPGDADRMELRATRDLSVEARFRAMDRLVNFTASWILVTPQPCLCPGGQVVQSLGVQPASLPVSFSVHDVGIYELLGFLRPASASLDAPAQGVMIKGPEIRVGAAWQVDGAVYPLRVEGQGPMAAKDMADIFTIPGVDRAVEVSAVLQSRGGGTVGSGTDVDLGLVRADGTAVACSRGSGQEFNNPGQAEERVHVAAPALGKGGQVWVGAQLESCGDWDYANLGPVPYRLTVDVWV